MVPAHHRQERRFFHYQPQERITQKYPGRKHLSPHGCPARYRRWVAPEVHAALKAVEGLRRGQARETKPIKPVADDVVNAVKPFVSRQVWGMIQVQRLTGMRPGEICILRTCDLVTMGEAWEYRPSTHKTAYRGKARVIFIGPAAQEVLRPWLRPDDDHAFLFQPVAAEAERRAGMRTKRKTKVQPSQQCRKQIRPKRTPGDRYTTGSYRQAVAKGCNKAFPCPKGQDPAAWRKAHQWHPHQLRHSVATRIRKEFGLDHARVVLGHTSPAVTETYAEIDMAKAAEVMHKIG